MVGSEFYKAPEICYQMFPCSGEKADMFSLGVVLFALHLRAFPFEKVKEVINSKKYKDLCNGKLEKFWPAEPSTSPEFRDLVMRMLEQNPTNRIGLDEVIGHPWTL